MEVSSFTCIGKGHGAPCLPATRKEWEALRREPWLAQMCARIERGDDELKHRLPVWTPSCAEFRDNHRSQADAIRPLRRLMMDFDEKGHTDEILEKVHKGDGSFCVHSMEVLLIEESVRRGTHVLVELPAGMDAETAQQLMKEATGFEPDVKVKGVDRCIYMVPEDHTKFVSDKLFEVSTSSPKLGEARRGLNLRLEGGSFGYLSAAGRISTLHPSPSTLHALSASYTRSDGYQRSKAGSLNSDYSGGKAFYQGSFTADNFNLNWHAGLSTKGFGSNTFYSAKFDEQFERTTKLYTAIKGETGGWIHFSPAIYWNRSYDRFELIRGSEELVPFNHHRTDVFGVNLNSWFDWLLGRTAFGAEFRNEDIISGNLGEPLNNPYSHYKYGLNRSNLSFHLEHNILLSHFTLSAGFIAVKNTWNEMPFTIYPGVDASYRIGENWKVYTSYNSSLRMPSFTELYYSVGGHKADKYLKPEELRAVEGGIKYLSPAVTAQVSVYHHHCRNMIDWILDPTADDPVWQSVNYTKVNTLGFETSATLNLERIFHLEHSTLNLAYSYIDEEKQGKEYIQTQSTLEYLRHKLVAQLQVRLIAGLDWSVKYRLQKRAGSYTTNEGVVMPYHTYDIVDTRLAWSTDSYSLYVEANNLLGRHYVDYGNVQQPGTWLMIGAKYHLNL